MIGIYKIINPKGKVYIGQSINIKKRWNYYKCNYHNIVDKQNKLFNSFKKYGIDNHIFEVIEECNVEQLNEREIYWGEIFNCTDINKGLNLRELGKQGIWTDEAKTKLSQAHIGKPKHTDESKAKISAKLKGTKYTEEQKQKCSENSGMRNKINHTGGSKKGWKRTPEQIEQIRSKKLGLKIQKDTRKIIQYDLNNNIIKEFKNITEAMNETGIRRDSIGNVLKNRQNSAGGYLWKYKIS